MASGLFVVSDRMGVVGAFRTLAEARRAALDKYTAVPFVVHRFPLADGPADTVWLVLYRDSDVVAFASNDHDEAERVRQVYARVGQALNDGSGCWSLPADTVLKTVEVRLEAFQSAAMIPSEKLDEMLRKMEEEGDEKFAALSAAFDGGRLLRVYEENERVTVLDCVVPLGAEALAADGAPPPADGNGPLGESPDSPAGEPVVVELADGQPADEPAAEPTAEPAADASLGC